jgi:hypothetical protein
MIWNKKSEIFTGQSALGKTTNGLHLQPVFLSPNALKS